MSQGAQEDVQGETVDRPAMRRVRVRPLFEDDGRRRLVQSYQILLGEEDISHLVRRVEIDLPAGGVAVVRLEILPSAVEVELDGLPILARGEPTPEELDAGVVDATSVGSDSGWRQRALVRRAAEEPAPATPAPGAGLAGFAEWWQAEGWQVTIRKNAREAAKAAWRRGAASA